MKGKRTIVSEAWDGTRKVRFQTGYEHDGLDFDTIIKIKFPAEGPESRAVKRDRLTKALRYWARGQLREWQADWEIYKPMMAEIERMMKSGEPVSKVQQTVMKTITERSYKLGTSKYQTIKGRPPGGRISIEEIEDQFTKESERSRWLLGWPSKERTVE